MIIKNHNFFLKSFYRHGWFSEILQQSSTAAAHRVFAKPCKMHACTCHGAVLWVFFWGPIAIGPSTSVQLVLGSTGGSRLFSSSVRSTQSSSKRPPELPNPQFRSAFETLEISDHQIRTIQSNMPKKMGVNSKAEEARARKSATEVEKKAQEMKEKEEQYWREAEGGKSKAAKKKEEETEKRAEAAARKAEAKRIAEMEEKELEKAMKKPDKKANRVAIPVPKVTEAELRRRKEEEEKMILNKAEEAKKKQNRLASEEEYEKMVLVSNTNRDDSIIEARSVEEALAKITIVDNLPVDRHPEKRLKASFKVGLIPFFMINHIISNWTRTLVAWISGIC